MVAVSVQTPYLFHPIEDFHQISLDLDFEAGSGRIVCDPNTCSLGPFGDRQTCTLIAPQSAAITLAPSGITDPTGQNRTLFTLVGSPLRNELSLVAPPGNVGDFRLIHTQRNGVKRVVSTEPIESHRIGHADEDMVCTPLQRVVDGQTAQANLVPGFVNGTWILIVGGKKPNLNTTVKIRPRIYVRQPEYWGFDIVDCRRGDFSLPAVAPYIESLDVTSKMGTQGVEVFWAGGQSQLIDLPTA